MNICPRCEREIEEGMELCSECAGSEEVVAPEDQKGGAVLVLEDGQSFHLSQETTTLGRSDPLEGVDPDVDLAVHGGYEKGVSRRHALIRRDGENWALEDLGSTNGTVLNRDKVSPGGSVPLSEGDVIHLGHLKAVFTTDAGAGGTS